MLNIPEIVLLISITELNVVHCPLQELVEGDEGVGAVVDALPLGTMVPLVVMLPVLTMVDTPVGDIVTAAVGPGVITTLGILEGLSLGMPLIIAALGAVVFIGIMVALLLLVTAMVALTGAIVVAAVVTIMVGLDVAVTGVAAEAEGAAVVIGDGAIVYVHLHSIRAVFTTELQYGPVLGKRLPWLRKFCAAGQVTFRVLLLMSVISISVVLSPIVPPLPQTLQK